MHSLTGNKSEHIKAKLGFVLSKNEGYLFLKQIQDVLAGETVNEDVFKNYSVNEVRHFTYAPITSCEVERAFSRYKYIFSDRRRRLLLPHLSVLLSI